MPNEAIEDADLGVAVELHHYDGHVTRCRGVFAQLPQSAAELEGAHSRSGPNLWVSDTPAHPEPVERVVIAPGTADSREDRVLDAETLGAAGFPTSTRYQLTASPR